MVGRKTVKYVTLLEAVCALVGVPFLDREKAEERERSTAAFEGEVRMGCG